MSANANVATRVMPVRDTERAHRIRLIFGYILAIALIAGLAVYGFDYYTLSSADRPFSPKHVLLKPSGPIGVKLGVLGFVMFLAIFLYPLRKTLAVAFAAGKFQALAGYSRLARRFRAVHHRFSLVVQVPGIRGHGFLVHAGGCAQRRRRTIPLCANSPQPEHR